MNGPNNTYSSTKNGSNGPKLVFPSENASKNLPVRPNFVEPRQQQKKFEAEALAQDIALIRDMVKQSGGFINQLEPYQDKAIGAHYEAEIEPNLPPLKITKQDLKELETLEANVEASEKYKSARARVKRFINETDKSFRADLKDYIQIGNNLLQQFCIEAIMGPITDPDPALLKEFIDRLKFKHPDLVVKLLDKLLTLNGAEKETTQQAGKVFAPIVINTGIPQTLQQPQHQILELE